MSAKLISASFAFLAIGVAVAQNTPDSNNRKETSRMDLGVRFKQLDTNGDGKLTLDELSSGFSSVPLGRRPAGTELKQEGASANTPQDHGSPPAMSAAEFFKSADKNNDGALSVDEFTSMVEKIRESANSSGGMGGGMKDPSERH
jgi:Ca2+-binding EF-hand superfamily protein